MSGNMQQDLVVEESNAPTIANSLFADLIEIAGGNEAIANARMKEFCDFSDEQHAAALNAQRAAGDHKTNVNASCFRPIRWMLSLIRVRGGR